MNIGVIFGGNSTEHDISVISGVEALNAMPVRGFRTIPLYLREGIWYTGRKLYDIRNYCAFRKEDHEIVRISGNFVWKKGKFGGWKEFFKLDCAVLATHGGEGENGSLQGFLEVNGIPYTSAGVRECAVCMDKLLAKSALSDMGIPVVEGEGVPLPAGENSLDRLEESLGYPMIIKPCSQGSSIGITVAENRAQLEEGMRIAEKFDTTALVERALTDFVELNVAAISMNGEILLSEIEKPLTAGDFLSFKDKYMGGSKGGEISGREFPAKISKETRNQILKIAKTVYRNLNLFGAVRMDFMWNKEGVYLNEINTIPGSLAHYLFIQFPYQSLLRTMVEEGMKRGTKKAPNFPSEVLSRISLDGSIKHK